MNPKEMLETLDRVGGDADYLDGEEGPNGWFGWRVTKDVLTVAFENERGDKSIGTWDLTGLTWKVVSGGE